VTVPWRTLQAAVAPVIADLERAHPGVFRVEPAVGEEGVDALLWDTRDGSGTGLWLDTAWNVSPGEVVQMAGQVQEIAIEELRRPWPPCPEHPGRPPLEPSAAGGRAVWTCPEDGRVIAEIGDLAAPEARRGRPAGVAT
jgi:hypothetical protein